MSDADREGATMYRAVVNEDEQYSIWPVNQELPPGWRDVGKTGTQDELLAWIRDIWQPVTMGGDPPYPPAQPVSRKG